MSVPLTKATVLKKLESIYWCALKDGNWHAALRAVELQGKAVGLFEKQLLPKVVRIADMTEEQLTEFIDRLEEREPTVNDQGGEPPRESHLPKNIPIPNDFARILDPRLNEIFDPVPTPVAGSTEGGTGDEKITQDRGSKTGKIIGNGYKPDGQNTAFESLIYQETAPTEGEHGNLNESVNLASATRHGISEGREAPLGEPVDNSYLEEKNPAEKYVLPHPYPEWEKPPPFADTAL